MLAYLEQICSTLAFRPVYVYIIIILYVLYDAATPDTARRVSVHTVQDRKCTRISNVDWRVDKIDSLRARINFRGMRDGHPSCSGWSFIRSRSTVIIVDETENQIVIIGGPWIIALWRVFLSCPRYLAKKNWARVKYFVCVAYNLSL